jgi:hypothetical protein
MSQVFSADSVNNTSATTVTSTSETAAVTGNFLNPPFGSCKACVVAVMALTVGTGMTAVAVRVRRNPNAENVIVQAIAGISVTAANTVLLTVTVNDSVPDGRPVQYQITVQQSGGAGNGSLVFSSIYTQLISG